MSRSTLPPKAMSSRLMTMKFMQRAAASTPPTTPQVQTHPQSQSTEPTPSKRQKTSDSPRPMAASTSNAQLIQPTLDEEECRREKAIEKLAEDAGETKWVLNTAEESLKKIKPNISVTSAGYSEIDDSTSSPAMSGRMSFGNFNRALELRMVQRHPNGRIYRSPSSNEQGSEASDDQARDSGDNDHDSTDQDVTTSMKGRTMGRADREGFERKQQKKAAEAELALLAEKRRKKKVKLNKLSSISGMNESGGRAGAGRGNKQCYECGEKGHERRDCPLLEKGKKQNHFTGSVKKSRLLLGA